MKNADNRDACCNEAIRGWEVGGEDGKIIGPAGSPVELHIKIP